MPQAASCCGRCLKQAPPWQRLRVAAHYEQPFVSLIHRLKYRHQPEIASLLGKQLAREIRKPPPQQLPEAILPVPLHWWRQWRRGYNQSSLIGQTLAAELGIALDESILKRTRATRSQSRLDRKERRQNLRHAFSVAPHTYQHVALLDDVVTTGTTAETLTRALLASGVKQVEVWAICRTITSAKS
jgi:Predicted amidophosphoribosyltransferases